MSIEQQEEAFDQRLAEMGIRIKDANNLKVSENVFDEVTLLALYKLVHKKWLTAIGGSISTGKEANVFLGGREEAGRCYQDLPDQSANFTTMSSYITGDRRFSHVKKSKKELIFAWTRKEFSNLARAGEQDFLFRSRWWGPEHPYHVLSWRGRMPVSPAEECGN